MSNAIDMKLNYFKSKLEQVRSLEMDLKMVEGQYNKEFNEWMKEQGIEGRQSLVDLIAHFRKKPQSDIIL